MKIAIVRGAFLNNFEMQNYKPLLKMGCQLVGFSSWHPIHENTGFPVKKLFSPLDLINSVSGLSGKNARHTRLVQGLLNRIFIDGHWLLNLEKNLKGFDIAHCAETYFGLTQQCLNAKNKGYVKKVIATVWENIPFNNEGIHGRKKYKQRAIKEIDQFICITKMAKEALIKEGCDSQKIVVIPMGVNLKRFNKQISKYPKIQINKQISNKQIKILFVGRMVKEKGIGELKMAVEQLIKNGYNVELKIVSNVPYEKMPKIYQNADIFCLPSKPTKYWQEQFGMVLIEAMASGLPIVATASGAIPEVIADAGILITPGNVKEIYLALKKLINNPRLRLKLSQKARKRAEIYFDCQKTAQKIEEVYENIYNHR